MLVLSRKQDEVIRIGRDVTVTVLSIGRGRIRLGIEAPSEVPILRGELRSEDELVLACAIGDD
jgi:carbon storage regulator